MLLSKESYLFAFNSLRYELKTLACLTLSFGEKQKGIFWGKM